MSIDWYMLITTTCWVHLWFQVEVPEDEDSYPEPSPPVNSRSDVFDPREYTQVDQHALKVSLQETRL